MDWRGSRADSRARYVAKYDAVGAADYDALVGTLDEDAAAAYLDDLAELLSFERGMRVLDAGAGTGALLQVLARVPGLSLTALDPAPAMLARLAAKPGLGSVRSVEGGCDAPGDRGLFGEGEFDVVASRQLVNCLFDPLAAFANWRHWLAPGGRVVAIDGLYPRAAWTGVWEEEVDRLPLSASQTMAAIPYLLEAAGFEVERVSPMRRANEQPSTATTRYAVVARRPDAA